MNAVRSMATAVRQRVFRRSVQQQTRGLDPAVRSALVDDIAQDETDLGSELHQIEAELEHAKAALRESERKETFLGQRSRQYRVALEERARALRDEQRELHHQRQPQSYKDDKADDGTGGEATNVVDEEENWEERQNDLDQRMEQWEKDEDALTKVTETHKTILAECERMRRKIKELEKKRKECRNMATEVGDFLQAATEGQHNPHELAGAVDDDEDDGTNNDPLNGGANLNTAKEAAPETEMSRLVTTTEEAESSSEQATGAAVDTGGADRITSGSDPLEEEERQAMVQQVA